MTRCAQVCRPPGVVGSQARFVNSSCEPNCKWVQFEQIRDVAGQSLIRFDALAFVFSRVCSDATSN